MIRVRLCGAVVQRGVCSREPLNQSRSPSAPLFAGGDGVAAMPRRAAARRGFRSPCAAGRPPRGPKGCAGPSLGTQGAAIPAIRSGPLRVRELQAAASGCVCAGGVGSRTGFRSRSRPQVPWGCWRRSVRWGCTGGLSSGGARCGRRCTMRRSVRTKKPPAWRGSRRLESTTSGLGDRDRLVKWLICCGPSHVLSIRETPALCVSERPFFVSFCNDLYQLSYTFTHISAPPWERSRTSMRQPWVWQSW